MAKLFEKWSLGHLELKNRIIIAPMCQYSAENGCATAWHTMHLGTLSHSGAGLLILEATAVFKEGRITFSDLGLYDDACEAALKKVIAEIRKYSSMPLAIQLSHAGRKASCNKPWLGGKQLPPNDTNGWQAVAPSSIPFHPGDNAPTELSVSEIEHIKFAFVETAKRAERLGFQGIEIHSAHGYLLNQFLSPLSNHRKDQYGGSIENRMRFPLEVFEAMRKAVSQDIPIWVRISATDWVEGGWTADDSVIYGKKLKALGCSAIHVSSGGVDPNQKIPIAPNYQVSFAEKIKNEVQIPTIAVGLITEPEGAQEILQSGKSDAVAIARAILYDTRWPWHAAAKLGASVQVPPQFLRSQPRGLNNLLQPDA